MKKTAKGILCLTGVLAVLGGGYAALRLTEPTDEEVSSSESVPETEDTIILIHDSSITETDPETGETVEGVIKTVDVKNKEDELHVIQKTAKTEDSAATYTLDGYQDIPMNDSVIGTLANNANGLTTNETIEENCTNLEKFGLANPEITVDITYESGTALTLCIGNEAPKGGETYVMLKGTDTVYTVRDSALANYSKTTKELVDSTILKDPGQDNYPVVKKLTINRSDLEKDIILEYDEKNDDSNYTGGTSSSHVMVSPTSAYLSVERSTSITTGMFGLGSENIYSVHCKDADIAEAGLKDPFCTVTMSCDDGNEYVLLLSEPFTDDNGKKSCYAMMKDGKVIYTVSAEKAQWLTVQPIDIASKIFIGEYVWNITELKASTAEGTIADFKISRIDPDEEKTSLSASDFRTTLNGADFNSERYRQFYSFLISANAEEFALDAEIPDNKPTVSLEYTSSYDGSTKKLDFYEYSNFKSLVTIDGESKFFITKSYVDTMVENMKLLDTDSELKTTWK